MGNNVEGKRGKERPEKILWIGRSKLADNDTNMLNN